MAISHLNDFKQLITELQIDYTLAEFHGFLSGLIAGGVQDNSWQTLTYQFTNNGLAFSLLPLAKLTAFYQQLSTEFEDTKIQFSLWINSEEDAFAFADSIAEWAAHFLLGLGLAQPKLQTETGEVKEAVEDISEIAKLGYDEDEDPESLLAAGEEVVEYLQVVALFLHSYFIPNPRSEKSRLH